MVVDLARQRQVHSNIRVIVECMIKLTLTSCSRYSDQSLVGDDRTPGVTDSALVVALEGVNVVTLHL